MKRKLPFHGLVVGVFCLPKTSGVVVDKYNVYSKDALKRKGADVLHIHHLGGNDFNKEDFFHLVA